MASRVVSSRNRKHTSIVEFEFSGPVVASQPLMHRAKIFDTGDGNAPL
jgi:hypothetical protein